MMKNFFSAELCEKNMLMAYAHNIKRVEKNSIMKATRMLVCMRNKI